MGLNVEEVKKVVVVGAGTMGHGIAQVCARKGYQVVLLDINNEILEKAMFLIKDGPFGLMRLVERKKLEREQVDEIMARIKTTTEYAETTRDADVVIEAVFENVELKKKVFKQLDELCQPHTIFATNTSGIMISELATAVNRPAKFIGMHWFNPAPVMRLIEVVRGVLTSDETFNFMVEFSKKLGKVPLEAKDGPCFFTTRFLVGMITEALRLFELGFAGIKEIDEMCKMAFGFPMGMFELMDLIGLDVVLHASEYLYNTTGDPRYAPPVTLKKLVMAGYRGAKPGSRGGWYDYFKIKKG